MEEIRKKQKRLKKIMRICVIFTAIFLLVYIGVSPVASGALGAGGISALNYASDILVIVSLVLVLLYYSRYAKLELFLNDVQGEIEDCGYYLTARSEREVEPYFKAVCEDLTKNGYFIENNLELSELEFDARALKTKEFFYIVCIDELEKSDVIAYMDSAVYDTAAINLKRRGNCVVLFLSSKVDEDALSLSKAVTAMGRKNQLKFTSAIVDCTEGRVYFSGLNPTKCQQMIANYVMGCEVPIANELKGKEKLKFQYELEEKMKNFDINDFKNGTFSVH